MDKIDGYKTYLGAAVLLLAAMPGWSPDVRTQIALAGLSLMGIGVRHAISKMPDNR